MKHCFKLAKKGLGKTSPNPMVGCVVLDKNGDLIAEGYHKKYGDNHAERDALLKVTREQAQGGTLYVNLEPCNHHGKTPPCTDIIIEKGIKRVVISCLDPNPKAKGGVEKLKSAGIEVVTGILEKEGRKLNEVFFTNIEQNRPFIALKCATTIDGKIATHTGDSKWITSEKARIHARKLRQQYDAILTSSGTVLADNPEMKHRLKIIIDRDGKCSLEHKIFTGNYLIFTRNPKSENKIEYIDLKSCIDELYNRGVRSIFVEAGGKFLGTVVKEITFDKLYHFIAPKILNDNSGKSAFDGNRIEFLKESVNLELAGVKKLSPDILLEYNKLPFVDLI